jgi:hypothetical protein
MSKIFILIIFYIIISNKTFAESNFYFVCEGSSWGSKSPEHIFPDTFMLNKPIKCTIKRGNYCVNSRITINPKGKQILSIYEFYKKNKKVIVKFLGNERHYNCK